MHYKPGEVLDILSLSIGICKERDAVGFLPHFPHMRSTILDTISLTFWVPLFYWQPLQSSLFGSWHLSLHRYSQKCPREFVHPPPSTCSLYPGRGWPSHVEPSCLAFAVNTFERCDSLIRFLGRCWDHT